MSETAPSLRLSDADREAAVSRLHQAGAEGRLDLGELEERVSAAYSARTQADLDPLLADLPAAGTTPPVARRPARGRTAAVRDHTVKFLVPNLICIIIWAATDPGGSFWPVWVLMGTGIAYVVAMSRLLTGDEDDQPPALRPPSPPGP